MQTPLPVQLEQWIKVVQNKKSPYDLKEMSLLHLKNIHAIIDKVIKENSRHEIVKNNWKNNKTKNENMFTR
jgi:hypothetical protein